MNEPAQCPFCDQTKPMLELNDFPTRTRVFCGNCSAQGPEVQSEAGDSDGDVISQAVDAWNNRNHPTP